MVLNCEFESLSWWGVPDSTLCDKVCQWHAIGRWFSSDISISPTNKTDSHDITEIVFGTLMHPADERLLTLPSYTIEI
jgi:hypothetical protein